MVRSLGRRGKFLMLDVGAGHTWVTHLGMSGRMAISGPLEDLGRHTRVVIGTDRGVEVRMVDPRTFGFMAVYTPSELAASTLTLLGPDALTELPTAEWDGGDFTGPPGGRQDLAPRSTLHLGAWQHLRRRGSVRSRGGRVTARRFADAARGGIGKERHHLRARSRSGAWRDLARRPRLPASRREGRPSSGVPGRVRTGGSTLPQMPGAHPQERDREPVFLPGAPVASSRRTLLPRCHVAAGVAWALSPGGPFLAERRIRRSAATNQ